MHFSYCNIYFIILVFYTMQMSCMSIYLIAVSLLYYFSL